MFEQIEKLMNSKKYEEANNALEALLSENNMDDESRSKASNMLGFIHIQPEYKEKSMYIAEQAFNYCIESKNPYPYSFYGYAQVQKDINICLNILKDGISKFPNNILLHKTVLEKSPTLDEKLVCIANIKKLKLKDFDLLVFIIDTLFNNCFWKDCAFFANKILSLNSLKTEEQLFFKLIYAYCLVFESNTKSLNKAEKILIEIQKSDIKNFLDYSHSMALILVYIKKLDIEMIIKYFDKLPSNGLKDFNAGNWLFYIEYKNIYFNILSELTNILKKDIKRREKIKLLKSMYLYSREQYFITDELSMKDLKTLTNYYKDNPDDLFVGEALFFIQKKFKMNYEAYQTYVNMYKVDSKSVNDFYFYNMFGNLTDAEFEKIFGDLISGYRGFHLNKNFINETYDKIIKLLFDSDNEKKYEKICHIADCLNTEQLKGSFRLFEIAYSYSEQNRKKDAERTYKLSLKCNSESSACYNNLGVIYENREDYSQALQFYMKAKALDPSKERYINNVENMKNKIKEVKETSLKNMIKNCNIEYLETIGYNQELISSFDNIKDEKLRTILLNDLQSCAICISTKQTKACTVLIGSIIEAILLNSIIEKGIKKYSIGKNSKNIKDMCLNELLQIANSEDIIPKTTYNLCHYLKDYRNIIHPSNYLRKNINLSEEDLMINWSILKKIIEDVLKNHRYKPS